MRVYSRARNAGLDRIARPGAFDRPFAFDMVEGQRIRRKREVAFRTAYLSGRPYPSLDLGLSREQRRAIFNLARVNTALFDALFNADLRLDFSFLVDGHAVVIYCGLRSLTGQRNPTSIGWDPIGNLARIQEGISRFRLVRLEWSFQAIAGRRRPVRHKTCSANGPYRMASSGQPDQGPRKRVCWLALDRT